MPILRIGGASLSLIYKADGEDDKAILSCEAFSPALKLKILRDKITLRILCKFFSVLWSNIIFPEKGSQYRIDSNTRQARKSKPENKIVWGHQSLAAKLQMRSSHAQPLTAAHFPH